MELALEPRSPEQWLEAVRQQERRGELIAAFDTAERGLAEHPGDLALEHRAVLALARTGATEEAARRLSDYGLSEVVDEDVAALRARIAKDEALAQDGTGRRRGAARAAEMYGDIVAAGGGYYPAVNAATLWLVAGDTCRAEKLACTVLELLQASGDDSYYAAATAAEANLLLRRQIAAAEALAQAAARHDGDYGALATTRRQLRLICETLDLDPSPLAVLAGPGVVHFCGHRIASAGGERFAAERESAAAAAIAEVVAERTPGFAYGALAAGADILWAEALLAAGAELHVILPFSTAEFVRLSVSPCGEAWVTRFERCVEAAAAVRFATDDASIGDDVLFRYGSELAMGLALLRARYLDANAWQLALWDGRAGGQDAGTAVDVAIWGRTGRPVTVVSPAGHDRADAGAAMPSIPPPPPSAAAPARVVHAMLFGDIKGFSKLTDEQTRVFTDGVLGVLAGVVRRHEPAVRFRNTWGDAVFIVLANAAAAARCALELQEAMATIDLTSLGLPGHLALRLGGHLGPVFPTRDPVLGVPGFIGSHISRTARIEPVTPPGAVYVTEPFAAALVLAGESEFPCDYVGHMPAAKDYGRLRMYRLRRERGASSPAALTPPRTSAVPPPSARA